MSIDETDNANPRPPIALTDSKESDVMRQRYNRAIRRSGTLQEYWNDEQKFNHIIQTGRYLKLVDATSRADEAAESAKKSLIEQSEK